MKTQILLLTILLLIFSSCSTTNHEIENIKKLYNEVSSEIDGKISDIILETTSPENEQSYIEITERFGVDKDPFTSRIIYRDYIAFPYYSIRKFKNALTGIIVKIDDSGFLEKSIIIKSENVQIEYFGRMKFNNELKINSTIKQGTFIGEMQGGGDTGMKLKIRMKYKGKIIDPSIWFQYQENPTTASSG